MVQASLLDVLEEGFVQADGSLGRRLAGAVDALGRGGVGDGRCPARTADSGYFELQSLDLTEPIRIDVFSGDEDPALLLSGRILSAFPPSESPAEDKAGSSTSGEKSGCSVVGMGVSGSGSPRPMLTGFLTVFLLLAGRLRRKSVWARYSTTTRCSAPGNSVVT
jgi:hypothetical protein